MVNAKSCKLNLPGMVGDGGVLHNPVVKGPVILKLQRAQGVGDPLQSVLNGVGKVVHGIDAPLVALTVMVHMANPVDHRVAHIEIAGGQVDFGSQSHGIVGELAIPHPPEQIQAFFNRTVPVGGDGGGVQVATEFLCLLRSQLADIGQPLLNQLYGILVILFKVIGAIEEAVAPVKTQPVDILLNGLNKFHILLGGVGIVHTQVAHTAELLGGAEVDNQGLAVADVQVAVGLRRETGVDGLARITAALRNILFNKRVDEILTLGNFSHNPHPLCS